MNKILKTSLRIFIYIMFAAYLACLFDLVFFKYRSAFNGINDMRSLSFYLEHSANFKPFKTIMNYVNSIGNLSSSIIITNILGNIAAFVPYGVFLPLALGFKGFLNSFIHSFILSLFIESIQMTFRVGSFDVDDIILNTLGGIIGYILYLLLARYYSKHIRQDEATMSR